jgi:hypothetical protein
MTSVTNTNLAANVVSQDITISPLNGGFPLLATKRQQF